MSFKLRLQVGPSNYALKLDDYFKNVYMTLQGRLDSGCTSASATIAELTENKSIFVF